MAEETSIIDDVKEYYGKVLAKSDDLQTNAACLIGGTKFPQHLKEAAALVHDDVTQRYYGCGLVIPPALEAAAVLDLGCGAGRDCYVIASLVGQHGSVTGLDMTAEQLAVARKYEDYHAEKFGFKQKNTTFLQGYIERLSDAGLKPNSFDIIVSNCVVNLSPDKKAVLSQAHTVLKEGGELYFSDVYADKEIPPEIRKHKVLWGECISGALTWRRLHELAADVGFSRPRLVSAEVLTVDKPELREVVEGYRFVSATYRLFKLPLDRKSPAQATYGGGIVGSDESFTFDRNNTFKWGEGACIEGELATILASSRLRRYFRLDDRSGGAEETAAREPENPFEVAAEDREPSGRQSCCFGLEACC